MRMADWRRAVGLALSWPAMSGAEPWTASKMAHSAPRFAPGTRPRPPTEGRAEVGEDVAVEVFGEDDVVLVGVEDELHAGVVDDVLDVGDVGELRGDFLTAAEEEAVGELHDVGLVDGVDLLAAVFLGVIEGCLGDARGAFAGDDFEGLRDVGIDHDLEAGVEVFGVLAEDDEVDVRVVGFEAGKIFNGAEVGVEVEFFAQRHVDGGEASTDGCGDGAFEGDAVLLDGLVENFGDVLARFGKGRRLRRCRCVSRRRRR